MSGMLENLNSIEWSKISHAYGPAADVPNHIRALLSPNTKEFESAIHQLLGNIWHQGTVYEATAYAVPFLYEVLLCPACRCRIDVLYLLISIANGSSYNQVHGQVGAPKDKVSKADFDTQLERELVWVKTAFDAVAEGRESLTVLLRDDDVNIRIASAFLLGFLRVDVERAITSLTENITS